MRQIGGEYNLDPFDSNATRAMPVPEIPPEFESTHLKWMKATATLRQHKYCANACLNFKSGSSLAQ